MCREQALYLNNVFTTLGTNVKHHYTCGDNNTYKFMYLFYKIMPCQNYWYGSCVCSVTLKLFKIFTVNDIFKELGSDGTHEQMMCIEQELYHEIHVLWNYAICNNWYGNHVRSVTLKTGKDISVKLGSNVKSIFRQCAEEITVTPCSFYRRMSLSNFNLETCPLFTLKPFKIF